MKAEYDFSKGKRGAVTPVPRGKTRITIRIDDDVLDWFRARVHAMGGGSYQTLINAALREQIRSDGVEKAIRRVVRDEILPLSRQLEAWAAGTPKTSVKRRPKRPTPAR